MFEPLDLEALERYVDLVTGDLYKPKSEKEQAINKAEDFASEILKSISKEGLQIYSDLVSGDIHLLKEHQEPNPASQNLKRIVTNTPKMPIKESNTVLSKTSLSSDSEAAESLKRSSEETDNPAKRQKIKIQGPLRRDLGYITNNYWNNSYTNNIVDSPRTRKSVERFAE
jgi:hypothetical protein